MPRRSGANKADVARVRKSIPSLGTALNREWKSALKKHGGWWFGRMALRFRAPLTVYGQDNPHSTLHNRTGALRNSMHHRLVGTKLADLRLNMWSDSPYAALQEYGGVIKPRSAKYLAIPIDDNLTAAGAPRFRSPRNVPDGRFLETSDGKLFFVQDTDDDVKFMFALRKKVDIPGPRGLRKRPSRLGMGDTALGTESRRLLRRRVLVGARRAITASFGGSRTRG